VTNILISRQQLMEVLGVKCDATLRAMIRRHELPPPTIGHGKRIQLWAIADLRRFFRTKHNPKGVGRARKVGGQPVDIDGLGRSDAGVAEQLRDMADRAALGHKLRRK